MTTRHSFGFAVLMWVGGCAAPAPVEVQWIDVYAVDYTLELVPRFDPDVRRYTALADAPGIVVRAQVITRGDAEGVTVDGEPAELTGFRTWTSVDEVVAPGRIEVRVDAPESPTYVFDVVPR